MGDLEDLFEPGPENESSQWRPRARAYAVSDIIGAAAGISLYAVVGIDSVVSWPSNQVLISDPNPSAWTTVPLNQFHLWQASFVREDGPLMVFGLFAATGFIALLHL